MGKFTSWTWIYSHFIGKFNPKPRYIQTFRLKILKLLHPYWVLPQSLYIRSVLSALIQPVSRVLSILFLNTASILKCWMYPLYIATFLACCVYPQYSILCYVLCLSILILLNTASDCKLCSMKRSLIFVNVHKYLTTLYLIASLPINISLSFGKRIFSVSDLCLGYPNEQYWKSCEWRPKAASYWRALLWEIYHKSLYQRNSRPADLCKSWTNF